MVRSILRWAAIPIVLVGCAHAAPDAPEATAEPQVVARVNGEPVTRGEWQRLVADPRTKRLYQREHGVKKADGEQLARWALQKLVVQRLVLQEAARRSITVTDQEVERSVAAWRGRFKAGAKHQKWLKSRAMDEKSLRETIRTDVLMTRVGTAVTQDVRVAEEEVRKYYEAHEDDLRVPEEVRLRIIAVKDRAAADEIAAAVHKGGDFDRLARERSIESRAAELGDSRWRAVPGLPPPLRAAVDRLKPGEISEPLQGGAEVIVVRLEERRPGHTKTLEEARPEIEQRLLPAKRQEAVRAWLKALEERAKIERLP